MPALLALLGTFVRAGLTAAKALAIGVKLVLVRMAISAKAAALYIASTRSAQLLFLGLAWAAFEVLVAAIAFLVVSPVSSSVLRTLMPSNSWAEGVFYLIWDHGLSLSYFWSLLLTYWANVFAVRRGLDILASALTYRVMVGGTWRGLSLGLLAGR